MERVNINGMRHYKIDGFNYPSVTTVLGNTSDKTFLKEWEERIGKEESAKISRLSCSRGTSLHSMIEEYLLNKKKINENSYPIYTKVSFHQVKKFLDNIKVYKVEEFLYSHKLKIAGACDCIGFYQGIPAIIDFKTSKWEKNKEDIEDYFLQCTAYSEMTEEMLGIEVPRIVIIMSCDNAVNGLIFIEEKRNYVENLKNRIRLFYEKYQS